MKLNLVLLSSLMATGCGLSEDKFLDKASNKYCDLFFDCEDDLEGELPWNDEGECVEFFKGNTQPKGEDADCEDDSEAAHDCLAAIDELECDDLNEVSPIPECDLKGVGRFRPVALPVLEPRFNAGAQTDRNRGQQREREKIGAHGRSRWTLIHGFATEDKASHAKKQRRRH